MDEKCPKCGATHPHARWLRWRDQLRLTCRWCGYRWHVDPLDRRRALRAEAERTRRIEVRVFDMSTGLERRRQ